MDIAITTFLNPSGLSYVGQSYFKCFSSHGMRVIPVWLGPPEVPESLDKVADAMLSASLLPLSDQTIQFHAGRADDVKLLKSRVSAIGSIVLEGNKLQNEHIQICKALDAVLVPSYFCRNICVSCGVPRNKVFYLPYPLDTNIWNPAVQPLARENNRFRFLYMNTCYERKGWDLLLKAYWQEFSANDNVELVIKSYREFDRQEPLEILIALEAAKLGIDRNKKAPIIIMDQVMPAKDMPAFMKSADALVSPHRSEGFGLNIWHAMALGVPVVCTDYGGNTDFTKSDTAWLVPVSGMTRPGQQEIQTFKHYQGITWAEPDLNELRRQMRACMLNRDEAARRAKTGASLVASSYSFGKVMSAFEGMIKTVKPGAWEKLCISRYIEFLAKQPSEKFESCKKLLTMIEI